MKKLVKLFLVMLVGCIFFSSIVYRQTESDNSNNVTEVIDELEDNLENGNVVEDGTITEEESTPIVESNNNIINTGFSKVGELLSKLVKAILKGVSKIVGKFTN